MNKILFIVAALLTFILLVKVMATLTAVFLPIIIFICFGVLARHVWDKL